MVSPGLKHSVLPWTSRDRIRPELSKVATSAPPVSYGRSALTYSALRGYCNIVRSILRSISSRQSADADAKDDTSPLDA